MFKIKKTFLSRALIVLFALTSILQSTSLEASIDTNKIFAVFTVDRTNEDEFWAHIAIENDSSTPLVHWSLGFTFQRIITLVEGAKIMQQIGDYYVIAPEKPSTIHPGGSATFKLQGKYTLRNQDDLPAAYFLILRDEKDRESSPLPIIGKSVLLPYKPKELTPGINDYELTIRHNETAIEGNPLTPVLPLGSSLIVPLPVELTPLNGSFILKPDTVIFVRDKDKSEPLIKTAEFLGKSLSAASGYSMPVQVIKANEQPENSILFTSDGAPQDLNTEGYLLQVDSNKVTIIARTGSGFFYGMQSLKQLFPPEIWHKNSPIRHSAIRWEIPNLRIKDYPRFTYRGVLLDSARHLFTPDQVKRLLDLMAMHKLNTFHWHLSDDEGWRIQIKRYPMLTDIGAWRGYGLILPPALGSSVTERYGGFYTQDEIRDIVSYAQERYITIIPEIDMPAHSRALIKSLPKKLQEADDQTVYSSVRGFHDNVLSPCLDATYEVINHIMDEIVTLFPGSYIHIGVDERPKDAWTHSPACLTLMKKERLKNTDELQFYFINKIQHMLAAKNKSIGAWEEAMRGGNLNKNPMPLIYSWTNAEAGLKAAEKGYDVVMSPASALYLELAYSANPTEPGDYWSGYVDTFTVYAYQPIPPNTPEATRVHIKGIEGALWSEYISSLNRLDYLGFPKLSALAEVAWTPASRRSWQNFSTRMGHMHLPRLDQYGVNYRISPPGVQIISDQLSANNEFPGLEMRYTLDNSTPTPNSELYKGPFNPADKPVQMRTFNTLGRGSSITETK